MGFATKCYGPAKWNAPKGRKAWGVVNRQGNWKVFSDFHCIMTPFSLSPLVLAGTGTERWLQIKSIQIKHYLFHIVFFFFFFFYTLQKKNTSVTAKALAVIISTTWRHQQHAVQLIHVPPLLKLTDRLFLGLASRHLTAKQNLYIPAIQAGKVRTKNDWRKVRIIEKKCSIVFCDLTYR